MSDHTSRDPRKETSPLERAAREAYQPTNRELMQELHRQNGIMRGMSNHMGTLERRLKPIENTHKRAMMIMTACGTIGSIVVSAIGYFFDIGSKLRGH